MQTASGPVRHHVVLVGAGNAHLRFARMHGMRPLPGVAVTLVNDGLTVPYSAMVPGHIAGEYTRDEVTIDLVRFCRMAGVRLVDGRATAVDVSAKEVRFADRAALRYHALSLGVGSGVAVVAGREAWPMRPLAALIDRLDTMVARDFRLAVVGGGASGCELTLAIAKRFPNLAVTLLQGPARLLPHFPAAAARTVAALLAERGVTVRTGSRVVGTDANGLLLAGGVAMPCDAALWATNAAPPPLLATTGLPLKDGFLCVRDTLQSVGDDHVFGTGDCVAVEGFPDLPRNGVHAVRQGGVLFRNVRRLLEGRPLTRWRPQATWLGLLNTSDGRAVLTYGPLTWRSRLARWLKDRIDRAWMAKFVPKPMPVTPPDDESGAMRCGGCGSKVAGDVLSAVLRRLDVPDDPRILVGIRGGEDAAVHRPPGAAAGTVEVQTADFFRAFIDDPYLFGRVAAVHAVSDLHAMNATPLTALAIATVPFARRSVQEGQLYELLAGATRALSELGVTLTGGHTTEGAELALGFAVTGYADESRLFRKGGLRPGDCLILTKPLGSGALLAAWMRSECRAEWFAALTAGLVRSNRAAAEVFSRHGVVACTDVTGFGLAGHLLEMLDASGVGGELRADAVPTYPGFAAVTARGVVSSLHADNARHACRVHYPPSPLVGEGSGVRGWLFDPQTAGGLLAGVSAGVADAVVRELRDAGCPEAAIIGVVTAGPPMICVR